MAISIKGVGGHCGSHITQITQYYSLPLGREHLFHRWSPDGGAECIPTCVLAIFLMLQEEPCDWCNWKSSHKYPTPMKSKQYTCMEQYAPRYYIIPHISLLAGPQYECLGIGVSNNYLVALSNTSHWEASKGSGTLKSSCRRSDVPPAALRMRACFQANLASITHINFCTKPISLCQCIADIWIKGVSF